MSQWLGFLLVCLCGVLPAGGQTLKFSGLEWNVKSGEKLGPGPNAWSPANVWVDKKGALHLKISKTKDGWLCAEVSTTKKFGFGTYGFQITGRIDQFDKNIVLGLFTYPTPDVGPDETNELDIEFARWGNEKYPNGNFTVWPAKQGVKNTSKTFEFSLKGDQTRHLFTWKPDSLLFQSQEGFRDSGRELGRWLFQPKNASDAIAQKPMPVLINLWLFQGHSPTSGKEVELIVNSFKFIPAP